MPTTIFLNDEQSASLLAEHIRTGLRNHAQHLLDTLVDINIRQHLGMLEVAWPPDNSSIGILEAFMNRSTVALHLIKDFWNHLPPMQTTAPGHTEAEVVYKDERLKPPAGFHRAFIVMHVALFDDAVQIIQLSLVLTDQAEWASRENSAAAAKDNRLVLIFAPSGLRYERYEGKYRRSFSGTLTHSDQLGILV